MDVSYGYCRCGCGQKTTISPRTFNCFGWKKGEPRFYVFGHQRCDERQPIRYGTIDGEPVAYIPLNRGLWAIVDQNKLHLVPGVWTCSNGYVIQRRNGRWIQMHRVVLGIVDVDVRDVEGDHRFGNKLDNRISQLRIGTHAENSRNVKLSCKNTSGYKGVSLRGSKWIVQLGASGKRIRIGMFPKDQLIEAAKAYDKAALKYFGSFARLNFPIVNG